MPCDGRGEQERMGRGGFLSLLAVCFPLYCWFYVCFVLQYSTIVSSSYRFLAPWKADMVLHVDHVASNILSATDLYSASAQIELAGDITNMPTLSEGWLLFRKVVLQGCRFLR